MNYLKEIKRLADSSDLSVQLEILILTYNIAKKHK